LADIGPLGCIGDISTRDMQDQNQVDGQFVAEVLQVDKRINPLLICSIVAESRNAGDQEQKERNGALVSQENNYDSVEDSPKQEGKRMPYRN